MRFMKKAIAGAIVAAASMAAHAGPVLDALNGPLNWKLQGTTSEYSPVAYGSNAAGFLPETTWGIGEITEINNTDGDAAWSKGQGGDYLYYVIYGIADLSVIAGGASNGFGIYNVGCTGGLGCDGKIHLDIYRMSAPISQILKKDPDDRIGFGGFNGLTNAPGASLYLALEFVPGKVTADDASTAGVDESMATLFQNVTSGLLPASGTGTFYAEAVGGSAKTKWDTNGFLGGAADFDANYTLKPNLVAAGGACPNGSTANQCFLGLINDPVQSNAIPEPAGLALIGVALAGLGIARRRRDQKAA